MADRKEVQRAFAALPAFERREIVRAVNRGRAVEVRKHAHLAVGVAQRQIRFWKVAWLLGPGLGLVQLTFSPPQVALVNGLFGTMVLGTFSWFWIQRAKRALAANHHLAEGRYGPPRSSTKATDGSGSSQTHIPPRPPSPRGKKRR